MGIDTKKGYKGYPSRQPQKSVSFATNLIGGDDVGATITSRINQVRKLERKEITDRQKRREQGYRGL